MKAKMLTRVSVAAVAAIGVAMALLSVGSAQTSGQATYVANLTPLPLNGSNNATGKLTLQLNGNQATITEQVSGLAATFMNAPYPHVQHIHGGAIGLCPTAAADSNGDKVLNTKEGEPAYGSIQTTLSVSGDTTPAAGTNIQTAPTGASFNYSRTITLDGPTMTSLTTGKAVIVVHGLDPALAAPAATSSPSELVPSLPLAATSPVLCGTLAQTTSSDAQAAMPTAPRTGNAGLTGSTDAGIGAVVLLVVAAAGTIVAARVATRPSAR